MIGTGAALVEELDLWLEYEASPATALTPTRFRNASLIAAMMIVGTGAYRNPVEAIDYTSGSGSSYTWHSVKNDAACIEEFLDVSEQIAALRRYLSLSISDLANVLSVERPTIYAWLAGNTKPRENNLRRLNAIYKLARTWRSESPEPVGRYRYERQPDGGSLIAYLSSPNLDEQKIRTMFSQISKRQVVRERKPTVAELATRHGFPEVPKEVQQRSFDEETAY